MRKLTFLITAGPTRESIDPVRFISNRSSGKMGYALAEAALAAGHKVTLVSGPVQLVPPRKARMLWVETALQMRAAVQKEARKGDVILMAAAVADYQPVSVGGQKLKKGSARRLLKLKRTPDILAELGSRRRPDQILVGFAAETSRLMERARGKLKSKNLDFIVANQVGRPGTGFESDSNQATLMDRHGTVQQFPRMTKVRLARKLIGAILKTR